MFNTWLESFIEQIRKYFIYCTYEHNPSTVTTVSLVSLLKHRAYIAFCPFFEYFFRLPASFIFLSVQQELYFLL